MSITKTDLDNCCKLRRTAENTYERIERLKSQAERATAQLTGMPRCGSISDPTGNGCVQYVVLRKQWEDQMNEYAIIAADVNEAIQNLSSSAQRDIMSLRYLDGLKWAKVAEKSDYSIQRCYQLHGEALNALGIENSESLESIRVKNAL